MPTQRIIKSTFIGLNNEPLRNAVVQVIHMKGNTIDNIEYPQVTKNFITDREGKINFTLWCNEEGERASFYRFVLPGGDTFDAIVPVGTSDLELSVLREGGGDSSAPQHQSVISFILSSLQNTLILATPSAPGAVKINSSSADPVVYLKSETDSLLSSKANISTTYNKTEVDGLIGTKANSSDVYTKAQSDTLLSNKANTSSTYSKAEVDNLLATKDAISELVDVTISSASNGQALVYNSSTSKWINQSLPAAGETNTASNVGVGGVGLFKQKTGVNLEFKNINAGSSKITVSNDAANSEIDIDVTEANLTLSNLGGTLSVAKGGTGSTTASAALTALGAASTTSLTSHTSNTSNPHSVTAAQVGAIPTTDKGIASGVATLDTAGKIPDSQIPDAITRDTELTTGLATKADTTALTSHTSNTSNPHSVTAAQVGAIATTARGAANGVASLDASTLIPIAQIPTTIARQSDLTTHTTNTSNPHSVTAAQVGNTTAQWNASQIRGINVHTTAPTNGQVLSFNSTNNRYEPTTAGSSSIASLTDATITSPAQSQILIYNGTSGKWENKVQPNSHPGYKSGLSYLHTDKVPSAGTLSLTTGSLRYSIFYVAYPITISQFIVNVTTAAATGSTFFGGIYSHNLSTALPDTLLASNTALADATGNRAFTMSLSLNPGNYWIALSNSGSPTVTSTGTSNTFIGSNFNFGASSVPIGSNSFGYSTNYTHAALPTTAPTSTLFNLNISPLYWLTIA
ncbi:MAG: hypothetical protein RMZ41_001650 [Nostoc sp. DedVER02]|uniref:hypothetical protein n=1 Tax=unclassified Nostoc TaxID=2593658 RepID=UPI002AD2114B|nr:MULTISPECIES: hypothetical protein [unclassified Nostoc]MDZ7987135.1 hypothetical protein [Nostoc sp. DedVER02]MDZ8110995.1 hypothetical protein [Nostoc sp. DedVER01b]